MFQFEQYISAYTSSGTLQSMVHLINYLRINELCILAIAIGKTCFPVFKYSPIFLNELAMCYYYNREYDESWLLYKMILSMRTLTKEMSNVYWFSAHFNLPHIMNKYETALSQPLVISNTLVTFSVTTCKRYDLFERTMNSFLACCEDIQLIGRWICVDDNSSEEDRIRMKSKYPFFEFFFKDISEKGHARSMNIIMDMVQTSPTPYLFHMEDDWQFHNRETYIWNCIEVLNADASLGQCLINRNYAETEADIKILGGQFRQTDQGLRYYVHDFEEDSDAFISKYGYGSNCGYWPHYSLRPGMNVVSKLRDVGRYSENAGHFEMEFAYRYASLSYKTAFLDIISCTHIGRLTSERNDSHAVNAYFLNNEEQFGPNSKDNPDHVIKVINLNSRSDRWSAFTELNDKSYSRYEAVNGYELQSTRWLEQMFNDNDYNYRRGMIGCALSHIGLWIECVQSNKMYVILEDDIILTDYFEDKLCDLVDRTKDIVFLGHHIRDSSSLRESTLFPILERCENAQKSLAFSLGGTGGYIISPVGAEKMLKFVNDNRMTNGIDTMMQKACGELTAYYCNPHLFRTDCYHSGNADSSIDTDIQRNYDSMARDIDERIDDEITYLLAYNINIRNNVNTVGCEYICEHPSSPIVYIDKRDFGADFYTYKLGNDVFVNIPVELVERYPALASYGIWDNEIKTYTLNKIIK